MKIFYSKTHKILLRTNPSQVANAWWYLHRCNDSTYSTLLNYLVR